MSQSRQQTNGFSFQSSLKSQDDSSIKYEAFNDEDYNKEAHNIEKVIIVIILNIYLRSYILRSFLQQKIYLEYFVLQIRTLGYSGQHPIFPAGNNKVVLVVANRLTLFDWMSKDQFNFHGQHVSPIKVIQKYNIYKKKKLQHLWINT